MLEHKINCPHCKKSIDIGKELNQEIRKEIKEELKSQEIDAIHNNYQIQLAEKDTKLNQTKKKLDEAKKPLIQSSSQVQGKAQELLIENFLKSNFPSDEIREIEDSKNGADVLQIVKKGSFKIGSLLYESKRTKSWKNEWIEKLKNDQDREKADDAILVTKVFPKGIKRAQYYKDIFICNLEEVKSMSSILRELLIAKKQEISKARNRGDNKNQESIDYLSEKEFKKHFNILISTPIDGLTALRKEKTKQMTIWEDREELYNNAITSGQSIYIKIRKILGEAAPHIENLEDSNE